MSTVESSTDAEAPAARAPAAFATTRWSVVARAAADPRADPGGRERRAALATLCEAYWYPVYAFARRKGHGEEDARDLVQGFFTRLLEQEAFARADEERGRFRSWLLACFVHHAAGEWERARAEKRGGGRFGFSLDLELAEGRFREEREGEDPERVFERAWALSLLEDVLAQLEGEYEAGGKRALFDRLRPLLSFEEQAESQRAIAEGLDTTEGAVKVALHRLRRRFGDLLRRAIADTVRDPEDVEDELRGLLQALNG